VLPRGPNHITVWLVLPVIVALAAALGLVLWMVEQAAGRLNAEAEAGGARLAQTLVEQNLGRLEELVYDNSYWDDAIRNLMAEPDAFWAGENVGWYWHETFGMKASFAVRPDGETVIGFLNGTQSDVTAAEMLGPALPAMMAEARRTADETPGTATAVARTETGFVFAALALFTPEYVQPGFPPPDRRGALIALRDLDAAFLAQAAEAFELEDLALQPLGLPVGQGRGAFELPGVDAAPVALLTWVPPRPGDRLRETLLLPMAAVGALVLLLFAFFVAFSRRVALRLDAARVAAEGASEAKSRFLANVSHELRTPLNAILGFSEMIKLGQVPPRDKTRQAHYGAAIHQSGQHLLKLIEDLLDLTKIESGRQDLNLESLNAADLVEEATAGLAPLLEARGHRVAVEVPQGLPPLIADRRAVRQILYNLLNNAAKFTPDGGSIVAGACQAPGEGIELFVRDNGIGIAAENLERVRQPFEQVADPRGTTTGGGTGLGLSIVDGLAKLHGGALRLETKPGRGTRAAVLFPAVPKPERPNRLRLVENGSQPPGETTRARKGGKPASEGLAKSRS
jgi:signal transduction histidine kinase